MIDWRTLGLGIVVFCATFAVGWWSGIGALMTPVRVSDAKPSQVVPEQTAPRAAVPGQPKIARRPGGPGLTEAGLTEDGKLRQGVIAWAKVYHAPACNQDAKTMYVIAATRYAEVLMRAAGCHNFPKYPMSMGQLDQVWQANRSDADEPVAQAMASVHTSGGLSEASFRGDVGRAVRVIAAADFQPGPPPACVASNSFSSRGFRFRIRR